MSVTQPSNEQLGGRYGAPEGLGVFDKAWVRVLEEPAYADSLEHDGYFLITARELKAVSGQEPRLMAKHDWSAARPWIFRELGLSMLAVRRDQYLVGRFDLYATFPQVLSPVKELRPPEGIESLDCMTITSEAAALSVASLTGMYEDFLGCGPLRATVSGRMSSLEFPMRLAIRTGPLGKSSGHTQAHGSVRVHVSRTQMEIDAGFESAELLCLVEAKNSLNDDFNIRQLFYPWARFHTQLSKPVVPVYQVYSNGVFTLYRFAFADPQDPRSIHCTASARYTLSPNVLDETTLRTILGSTRSGPEPEGIPFPQANNFERIINLCELALAEPLTLEDIWEHYGFDPRQARYYLHAAMYLGWMEPSGESFALTPAAESAFTLPDRNERNAAIITALAQRAVFREALGRCHNGLITVAEVQEIMRNAGLTGRGGKPLAPATLARRAETVHAWVEWVWGIIAPPEALF